MALVPASDPTTTTTPTSSQNPIALLRDESALLGTLLKPDQVLQLILNHKAISRNYQVNFPPTNSEIWTLLETVTRIPRDALETVGDGGFGVLMKGLVIEIIPANSCGFSDTDRQVCKLSAVQSHYILTDCLDNRNA